MKVNEFKLSILSALEKINLDPVFDYSQADREARKIIAQTFNNENEGKELSVIFSNIKQSAELIYEKSGVFDHGIQDGELSTSKVGTNAIDFCKALIHLIREQLKDLETQEIFIPIALKWHVGVAVFILDSSNDGIFIKWFISILVKNTPKYITIIKPCKIMVVIVRIIDD